MIPAKNKHYPHFYQMITKTNLAEKSEIDFTAGF